MKNISFLSEFFQFLEVTFSIYLNRRVFEMFRTGRRPIWISVVRIDKGTRQSLAPKNLLKSHLRGATRNKGIKCFLNLLHFLG